VLDASVALSWFVDHPISSFAEKVERRLVQGEKAVVPGLWHVEMANGLIVAQRRSKLSVEECARAIEKIRQLLDTVIETSPSPTSLRQNFETAGTFHLTAYDAIYLDAARSAHLPLATLDRQMRKAAEIAGIEVLS
jgi:predicted nucleic acid-binding protein